ncbi:MULTISPECIES: phosphopantetheine adenylyltransferase [unclassified Pseudomonas]|uniref:phosphopantetheine adenylyltransferase n=1 Tax=unclassified Pseudomonas TaxID=196821 RepID=UPI00244D4E17|nr:MULTISPECIES: phosphopantetheine adenylyltransferase [unclassified Pseudomonas]MDG9922512.1 phosphopantetheine adenylyltransferase [Pseudomonas sp. GD04045]MDH0034290.1 phosphopantetheine adenylyltransferase [Pseudomonas sp. GD04019]
MANKLIALLLLVAGIIHLLPLAGVLGGERLNTLYGLALDEPNLQILMRHRAVLFGLLGAFLLAAAFIPGLRTLALLGGLLSVISFLLLAWSAPLYNEALRRVVVADWVALACLLLALLLHLRLTANGH